MIQLLPMKLAYDKLNSLLRCQSMIVWYFTHNNDYDDLDFIPKKNEKKHEDDGEVGVTITEQHNVNESILKDFENQLVCDESEDEI